MHRTTFIFDDGLIKNLRAQAAKNETTLTELVKIYIRDGLNRGKEVTHRKKRKLPSFSMGVTSVDPADRETLWDFLDKN